MGLRERAGERGRTTRVSTTKPSWVAGKRNADTRVDKVSLGSLDLDLVSNLDCKRNEGSGREKSARARTLSSPSPHPFGFTTQSQNVLTSLKILRDVSLLVGLHDEIKVSTVVVSRGGGVGPSDDLLSDGSLDLNVLPDGESEDGVGGIEGEAIAAHVKAKTRG